MWAQVKAERGKLSGQKGGKFILRGGEECRKTRESFGYRPKSAVTVNSKDTGHRVKQTAAVIGKRGTKRSIIPVQSITFGKQIFPLHSMCSIFNFNQKQVRSENVQAGK